jgi:hypothetical protein
MATVGEVLATYFPRLAFDEGHLHSVDPSTQEATPVDLSVLAALTPEAIVALEALAAAGFGTAGQVLATNSEGDGFEWIDLEA